MNDTCGAWLPLLVGGSKVVQLISGVFYYVLGGLM